ncbi:MAG: carbohydrate porin [Planctomycetaceae bacterium]|nr:carbohydrate porin [Planctomycetaceae bacterium]
MRRAWNLQCATLFGLALTFFVGYSSKGECQDCLPCDSSLSCDSYCFEDSLWDRDRLLGDLFGARSSLEEQGIAFDLIGTTFYQGVASGGREQAGELGGKMDYLLKIDGQKAGLQEGLFIDLHGESRLGQSVNNIDGLLMPANVAMAFPERDRDITALSGFKITQALSENFAVYAGKINTLDEYPLTFSPQLGLNRPGIGGFMNTSLVFNPILGRTVPYSALGIGGAVLRDGLPFFAVTVFDPRERSTIGLQDPYAEGVTIVPDLTLRVEPLGLPGTYNFGGSYSTADHRSVDRSDYLFIPDIGIVGNEQSDSWSLYANFFQALWVDCCNKDRQWGIFGQFGISDGNPNPIRYVANGGVAGHSLIRGREIDTFGIGFFYVGLSESFKGLAAPILPQRDEYGLELFYNYAITPWCRLTGDLQIAQPSTKALDTAIIPGMRLSVLF